MCIILSIVFLSLTYFYVDENNIYGAILCFIIALGFIILIFRNIIQVKKDKIKNKGLK
jgi:hypothetical protein